MGRTYINACLNAACLCEESLAIDGGREAVPNFYDGLRCQQVLDATQE